MKPQLDSAIRSEILKRIPMTKLKTEDQKGLLVLDLRELFSKFYNWQNRRVSVRPRRIHISRELEAKNRPEAKVLAEKIKKGEDLTPHLSTRVKTVFTANPSKPGLGSRRDLDLLLSEWGIHHLHISTVVRANGFVKRGKDLLFVAFKKDDAYLIDLLDHNAFTNESVVHTAVRNWPNAGLFAVIARHDPRVSCTGKCQRGFTGCRNQYAGSTPHWPCFRSRNGRERDISGDRG
jgi:hypothetical protein